MKIIFALITTIVLAASCDAQVPPLLRNGFTTNTASGWEVTASGLEYGGLIRLQGSPAVTILGDDTVNSQLDFRVSGNTLSFTSSALSPNTPVNLGSVGDPFGKAYLNEAAVFIPIGTGPDAITNGLSAMWNSNGVATYLRCGPVGYTTNKDVLITRH